MPRRNKSSGRSSTAEVSRELAWEVYESLDEAEVVDMLRTSKQFVDLCQCFQKSRRVDLKRALLSALKQRSDWLRKNPVYAAHVFLMNWPKRRPPTWVMEWIAQGLRNRVDGKGTLDALMGFGGSGRRAFTSAKRRDYLLAQFVDVARLMALGLKTRQAAHLVCSRDNPALRAADDVRSADRLLSMTNTLVQGYQHYPGRNEMKEFFQLMLRKHGGPGNRTAKFVSTFPRREVLRTDLRKFLS